MIAKSVKSFFSIGNNLIATRSIYSILFFGLMLSGCNKHKSNKERVSKTLFQLLDTARTGVNFKNALVESEKENHLINENFVTGGGVAVGDINNDGLADIYFGGNQVSDKLYLNKGNLEFEDITEKAGLKGLETWSTGISFADVNNDGYEDIYVCKNVQGKQIESKNLLFINNKDLTFSEKSEEYRVADDGYSIQVNFFDYDKDGFLDMYLVNQPPGYGNRQGAKNRRKIKNPRYSDKLYKNLGGNNGFVEVSPLTKTENMAYGLSSAIGDINNDGWQDIYVANDYEESDYFYLNNAKGSFNEVLKNSFKHISNFSMGSDIADYDNDGNLDLIILDMVAEDHKRMKTNMGGMNPENFWNIVNEGGHYQYMFNTLQRNNGNGTFSDLAQLAGISNTDWSWGPLLADFDNDGLKDLFITNGIKRNMRNSDVNRRYEQVLDSLEVVAKNENKKFKDVVDVLELAKMAPEDRLENYMFKNKGDLTFIKKNKDWGFATPTLSNGSAYADLDNDGDLDLIVSNIDENAFIYRNQTIEKDQGNYLRLSLRPSKNSNTQGARVSLFRNSQIWQTVEVSNARGYMSKSENTVHFGIGDMETVEKIHIKWPDNQITELQNINGNQLLEIFQKDESPTKFSTPATEPIFTEITQETTLVYRHIENEYDDYEKQVLLPHKMSRFGPSLAVADVNGDGLDDFFVGGSAGYPGALYFQNSEGKFYMKNNPAWILDKASEDAGCIFFDIDKDGDQDLFVVSGGNEFNKDGPDLQDRLYVNDGSGNFTRDKKRVSEFLSSGSIVSAADYDGDGDIDLFVGGRQIPGEYPSPANSTLLENNNGYLSEATKKKAPEFESLGMVTAAEWTHLNGDNKLDLIVVGEWMPITTFIQTEEATFKRQEFQGLEKTEGWYYSVTSSDMDNDGDQDFIVGNLGLNYKYKASTEHPFQVHSADFDSNGTQDIVLSYYEEGGEYPIRGRSCSIQQIPSLDTKFPSFESFGSSDIKGIYGEELEKALNLKAYTFASYYVENIENKTFKLHELPQLAQVSNINSILAEDFDHDGIKDLVVCGNLYSSEIETPRNDAGIGLFLKGKGDGNFNAVSVNESGFLVPHDAKDMKKIKIGNKSSLLIGNNDDYLQVIDYN